MLVVKARLARTGKQDYGTHIETRPAGEVFHPNSLATYEGAPVTIGHRAFVTSENVDELAVGYVRAARRDPHADAFGQEYVDAELVINDAETEAAIRRGDLAEVSMQYAVEVGDDNVQRNIRINAASLGPKNWARCGSGCSLAPTLAA